MPRKKTAVQAETPPETAPTLETTSPSDGLPPSDVNGTVPEAAVVQPNGNGSGNRPAHVLSYLIGHEVYCQVAIWERHATRKDGTPFCTYDVRVQKRYRDPRDGEWKTLYGFAASELYAVIHGLQQAACWVAEARTGDCPF